MKTLNQFILDYTGQYVAKDGTVTEYVDWTGEFDYAGQCASLVVAYLNQCLDRPVQSWGNAYDYLNLLNSQNLGQGVQAQAGDLMVWGRAYGNGNGHVGIYTGSGVFNQNPYPAQVNMPLPLEEAYVIRPNELHPVLNLKDQAYGGQYVVTQAVNVRTSPSLTGEIVASYQVGEVLNLDDSRQLNDGYVWGSYIARSGIRRYVAIGRDTGQASAQDFLRKLKG